MSEPTISLTFKDLYTEVSDYLGYGRGPEGERLEEMKRYVNDGYARFLLGVDPRTGRAGTWSFLVPEATLSLAGGTGAYALPDDFAYLVDDFTYDGGAAGGLRPATVRELRAMAGGGAIRGTPRWFAVCPSGFAAATGQRWEVLVHPLPSAEFTLRYRYRVNPQRMVEDAEYPMGGALHAQAVLACGLAVAEERRNDGQHAHRDRASDLVAASIDLDARAKPSNVGYNADGGPVGRRRRGAVTYA